MSSAAAAAAAAATADDDFLMIEDDCGSIENGDASFCLRLETGDKSSSSPPDLKAAATAAASDGFIDMLALLPLSIGLEVAAILLYTATDDAFACVV